MFEQALVLSGLPYTVIATLLCMLLRALPHVPELTELRASPGPAPPCSNLMAYLVPIGSMVFPFCGSYLGSSKVTAKRNHFGAYGVAEYLHAPVQTILPLSPSPPRAPNSQSRGSSMPAGPARMPFATRRSAELNPKSPKSLNPKTALDGPINPPRVGFRTQKKA